MPGRKQRCSRSRRNVLELRRGDQQHRGAAVLAAQPRAGRGYRVVSPGRSYTSAGSCGGRRSRAVAGRVGAGDWWVGLVAQGLGRQRSRALVCRDGVRGRHMMPCTSTRVGDGDRRRRRPGARRFGQHRSDRRLAGADRTGRLVGGGGGSGTTTGWRPISRGRSHRAVDVVSCTRRVWPTSEWSAERPARSRPDWARTLTAGVAVQPLRDEVRVELQVPVLSPSVAPEPVRRLREITGGV